MLYLFRTTEVFFFGSIFPGSNVWWQGHFAGGCPQLPCLLAANGMFNLGPGGASFDWSPVASWRYGKKNQMIIQSCFVCCMVKQSSSFFFFLFSFFGPWSNILLPIGTFDTASNKAKKPLSSLTDQKILRLFPHTLHMQQGLPWSWPQVECTNCYQSACSTCGSTGKMTPSLNFENTNL